MTDPVVLYLAATTTVVAVAELYLILWSRKMALIMKAAGMLDSAKQVVGTGWRDKPGWKP